MMFKKLLQALFISVFLLGCIGLQGQAGSYGFSVSNATYTPVSAGATNLPAVEGDTQSDDAPIGFSFEFEGVQYDSVSVASDGFISFVKGASSTFTNDLDNGSAVRRPLVAPLWDDLDGSASSSQALYETSGNAPNRVFTFEWREWEWNWLSTDSVVSFQVKLFETSNEIEFHYDFISPASINSPSASIGLSGASSFLSVFDTSSTPTVSNVGEFALIDSVVTGRVFTFTPPSCVAPTQGQFSFVSTDSVQFNFLSGTPSGPFDIEFGPTGFTQGTNLNNLITVTDTLANVGSLASGTTYDFYVRLDCGGGSQSNWAGPFSVSLPCPAQNLPVVENFNSGLGCFTIVDGGTTNDTWFVTSNRSGNDLDGTDFMIVDSDAAGNGPDMVEELYSPIVDASGITGDLVLQFDQFFNNLNTNDTGFVEVFDGSSWVTVLTQNSDIGSFASPDAQRLNLSVYANANFQVRFRYVNNSAWAWYWAVDNFSLQEILCNESSMMTAYAISADSISVSWTPGTGASFGVEFGVSGFTPGSGTLISTTDTFATANGLLSNTAYDFYVTDSCSGGSFSNVYGPITFSTLCNAIAVPFTETFNSTSTTEDCWTVLDVNGDGDAWNLNYGFNTLNGDEVAALNTDFNNGANDDWLISPAISFTGNEQLAYYYRMQSSFEPNDFEVLVSTTGINPSDFTDTLVPLTVYSNTTYMRETIDMSAYTGSAYIAWHVPPGGLDGWRIFIDSVLVEALPPCPAPSQLNASNILPTQADLSWTNPNATAWNIEVGPPGFVQGSGTVTNVTTNPYTLTSLTSNTCYDYYVRQDCGSGLVSSWSGPFSFCTPPTCPAPTNLGVDPNSITINSASVYFTPGLASNFNVEFGTSGFTLGTGTSVQATNDTVALTGLSNGTAYEFYVRDSCSATDTSTWTGPFGFVTAFSTNYLEDVNGTVQLGWYQADAILTSNTVLTPGFSSWGTDVFANNASTQNTTNAFNANIYTNQTEWVISPSIYLDPTVTNYQVEFDAAVNDWPSTAQGYFDADDTLAIVISTDNGSSWSKSNIIWEVTDNDTISATGDHIIVPLTGYSGYVRFGVYAKSTNVGASDNDYFIDNFEVRTPRACPSPVLDSITAITTSSAVLNWTNGDVSASSWDIILTTGNQPAASGMVTTVTSGGTFNFIGLTAATSYCAYLVETCANGVSDTAGPLCFNTECSTITAPYFEDFEGGSAGCWKNETVTGTKEWTLANGALGGTGITSAYSGVLNARFTSSAGGPHITKFVSPIIDASSLTSVELSFYYGQEVWAGDQNSLTIYYRTSSSAPWISIWSDNSNVSSWKGDTVSIPSNSATLQIAFEGVDDYGRANVIDDIRIAEPAACPAPSNLDTISVSCDEATVTWNSSSSASSSIIEYGAAGFTLGTGTNANSSAPFIITALSAFTNYDFYVRDVCASGDTSAWSGPYSFTTDPVPAITASFTSSQTSTTLNDAVVTFDASASTGATNYAWNFGNGTTGTNMIDSATYTMNQSYTVTLVVTGPCGSIDSTTQTITVAGINLEENAVDAVLTLFPNPSKGVFNLSVGNIQDAFDVEIIDPTGRVIYTNSNLAPSENHRIDVSDEAAGIYIISIKGKGLLMKRRIVLNK